MGLATIGRGMRGLEDRRYERDMRQMQRQEAQMRLATTQLQLQHAHKTLPLQYEQEKLKLMSSFEEMDFLSEMRPMQLEGMRFDLDMKKYEYALKQQMAEQVSFENVMADMSPFGVQDVNEAIKTVRESATSRKNGILYTNYSGAKTETLEDIRYNSLKVKQAFANQYSDLLMQLKDAKTENERRDITFKLNEVRENAIDATAQAMIVNEILGERSEQEATKQAATMNNATAIQDVTRQFHNDFNDEFNRVWGFVLGSLKSPAGGFRQGLTANDIIEKRENLKNKLFKEFVKNNKDNPSYSAFYMNAENELRGVSGATVTTEDILNYASGNMGGSDLKPLDTTTGLMLKAQFQRETGLPESHRDFWAMFFQYVKNNGYNMPTNQYGKSIIEKDVVGHIKENTIETVTGQNNMLFDVGNRMPFPFNVGSMLGRKFRDDRVGRNVRNEYHTEILNNVWDTISQVPDMAGMNIEVAEALVLETYFEVCERNGIEPQKEYMLRFREISGKIKENAGGE